MKITKYRKKRWEKGLTKYTVAKALGIDYWKYMEIERGVRPLESEYLDKFNKVIENASELRLEHAERIAKVKEFLQDKEQVKKKLKEYGATCTSLARNLGFSQPNIYNALFYSDNSKNRASDDVREMVYDYLNDPMNKEVGASKLASKEGDMKRKSENSINIPEQEKNAENGPADIKNEGISDNGESENKNTDKETIQKLREVNKSLLNDNFKMLSKVLEMCKEIESYKHQIRMYEKLIEKL